MKLAVYHSTGRRLRPERRTHSGEHPIVLSDWSEVLLAFVVMVLLWDSTDVEGRSDGVVWIVCGTSNTDSFSCPFRMPLCMSDALSWSRPLMMLVVQLAFFRTIVVVFDVSSGTRGRGSLVWLMLLLVVLVVVSAIVV